MGKDLLNQNEFKNGPDSLFRANAVKYINEIEANRDHRTYMKDFDTHCIGAYFHALKMTLHYLKNFDSPAYNRPEGNISKYVLIMNEICDMGGDTDTNAAIVGMVIGPLVGYKLFGRNLDLVLKCIEDGKEHYSSILAYFFIEFLEKYKEQDRIDNSNAKMTCYFLTVMMNMTEVILPDNYSF